MEAALAHIIKDKAEAAYARSDLFDRRHSLMTQWAGYLNLEPEQGCANGAGSWMKLLLPLSGREAIAKSAWQAYQLMFIEDPVERMIAIDAHAKERTFQEAWKSSLSRLRILGIDGRSARPPVR